MRDDQIQASVPAPVASLPPREPMPTVHLFDGQKCALFDGH